MESDFLFSDQLVTIGIPLARLQHGNENACMNERGALQYIGKGCADGAFPSFPAMSEVLSKEKIWISKGLR